MAEASDQKSDTGKFSMADIPPERLREYEKMPCLDFVNAVRRCACKYLDSNFSNNYHN